MRILCLDDEELALQMLEMCVKKAKPEAEVWSFDDQEALLEDAENGMTAFGAAGVFDIWESEMITGDPRNSIYIRGD